MSAAFPPTPDRPRKKKQQTLNDLNNTTFKTDDLSVITEDDMSKDKDSTNFATKPLHNSFEAHHPMDSSTTQFLLTMIEKNVKSPWEIRTMWCTPT